MLLKNEERAVFALRSLYRAYGYLPFKMSKFEEYDLYVRNKDFLLGNNVITFNDTDGRLLAMKPDVTLSIIKNIPLNQTQKEKVFYNENVYRVSAKTHRFKETSQAGLECIGDIDVLDVFEVVYLAAKSLSLVSSDFALDISHMGILSSILDSVTDSESFKKTYTKLISEKNKHEAAALIEEFGLSLHKEKLLSLIDMYGDIEDVLKRLRPLCWDDASREAYEELETLCSLLLKTELHDRIKIDFSVVNNMKYYNGIVFKGFLSGIFEGVLSGGEYGKLLSRMGREGGAVGFAMYLDLLEELDTAKAAEYDVDTLLLYTTSSDASLVAAKKEELIKSGESVYASKTIPEGIRYKKIINIG